MANTKYGDINQRTAAWAATEMLAHAEPILVLSKFGTAKPLPKNAADTVKFRRPVPFTVSTTALTEGVTPTAQQMSYEDVTATISQYGAVAEITDKVADLAEDPVMKDAAMLSGEQAAETLEMITYGTVKGGTNVFYADGTTRPEVASPIVIGDIRAVTRSLKSQRGKYVTQMMSSSTNYATQSVEGGFIAFGHTDLEADLRGITGFKSVADYGSRKPLCPEEVGSVESLRFILSPLFAPWLAAGAVVGVTGMKAANATNIDVYPVIVIAKDAFGLIPLKGENAITPMVINPGSPTKSDPLGQMGYVAWKTYFTSVRLNEAWIARIEVAVTDL